MKKHVFSFNLTDSEVQSDIRRVVSDFREAEKINLLNESNHIESILEKPKQRSALLKRLSKYFFYYFSAFLIFFYLNIFSFY